MTESISTVLDDDVSVLSVVHSVFVCPGTFSAFQRYGIVIDRKVATVNMHISTHININSVAAGRRYRCRRSKNMAKEMTLEQMFEQLEESIGKLEQEDISLEDSFKIYREGMKLIQTCNEKIDKVEKEVLKLSENGELDEF